MGLKKPAIVSGGVEPITGTFKGDAVTNKVLTLPDVAGKENIYIYLTKEMTYGMNDHQITMVKVVSGVVTTIFCASVDSDYINKLTTAVAYDGNGNFTIKDSYRNFGLFSSEYEYIAF